MRERRVVEPVPARPALAKRRLWAGLMINTVPSLGALHRAIPAKVRQSVSAAYHFPDLVPPVTVAAFAPTDRAGCGRTRGDSGSSTIVEVDTRRLGSRKYKSAGRTRMPFMRWTRLPCCVVGCGCAAQPRPMRPVPNIPTSAIRSIVPQAPGSATDAVARVLAADLDRSSIRPSSSRTGRARAFTIGLDIVAKAAPDGYTLAVRPDRRARHQPGTCRRRRLTTWSATSSRSR